MEGNHMKNHNISAPHFNNEDKAREYLERLRWHDGIICPHCGVIDNHYPLTPKPDSKESVRKGVYKCKDCRKQFTVTVGTVFERSHIPLNKWLLAIYLLCSSKKGMSGLQLSKLLNITQKTAWHLTHRIRYAMAELGLSEKLTGIVEADETYIGGKGKETRGRGAKKKTPVFSLVERNGKVRSTPVERVTSANLKAVIRENVSTSATIMTDEFKSYHGLGKEFVAHKVVNHGRKEYVRGDAHTNTLEGYFSLLKRGIVGIYHHVNKEHLHRYLNEFDFRYNTREMSDSKRMDLTLRKIEGKRLQYRDYYQQRKTTDNLPTLTTPDAIHLATAIIYRANEFHTFDEHNETRKRRALLPLNGNVAGYPIVVCKPPIPPIPPQLELIQ